ncbi:MAG TPA: hypothetical protein VM118_03950 [Acidobacteriota bacterium]|nr:hypothetical protein [Acidobacteriota bacterium]
MKPSRNFRLAVVAVGILTFACCGERIAQAQGTFISEAQINTVISELAEIHGEAKRAPIERGVRQVANMWRADDGSPEEFAEFCKDNYIADPETRQKTADRYETAFASIYGHLGEMDRDLSWNLDIATGPLMPIDYAFARLSLGSHLNEDMFKTKIGFMALLNYPLYTLDERLADGPSWNREEWAQARLVESFAARVPPEVSQKNTEAYIAADTYIGQYNIFMHHLLAADGTRPFPEKLRLVSHWNLRDELKAQYSEPDGLAKQEMIFSLMQKIIRQEIPAAVINNPTVDWNMTTNAVTVSPIVDGDIPEGWHVEGAAGDPVDNARESDTRYSHLLAIFHAQQRVDPYYPTMPTLMDRRFQRNFEIPETEVVAILKSVLSSPTFARAARLVEQRLGRPLRPFDIWYDGFKARGTIAQDELDRIVGEKYPTVAAFQADLPRILQDLGFSPSSASFLVDHIAVDPSRGIGHASGPGRREDKARLRTRFGDDGMDYKGYNIATHEFGHNVEQVLSLTKVDHTLLRGVPNTAFTEGFAFVFQARDLELLGIPNEDPHAEHMKTLDILWGTAEIGAVSLVDISVWNWMYNHPEATPADLREAVIAIAKDVWNEYYAPVFGMKDVDLLGIYSHMIDAALYLPNYPLGHIIAFQVEEHLKNANLGEEMERMCRLGSITPGIWMQEAVGGPISTAPLLQAAEEALDALAE